MRYIDKSKNPCQEFMAFVKEHESHLKKWDDLTKNCGQDGSKIKTKLHNHLVDEQKGLCIYCERRIHNKEVEEKFYRRDRS